jgi:hypothetical protein
VKTTLARSNFFSTFMKPLWWRSVMRVSPSMSVSPYF